MSSKVHIIERERGWGPRIEDELTFENENVAEAFVRGYNRKYNPADEPTPDWYMYASLNGTRGNVLR